MDEFETFDPALFGLWAERPVYGEGPAMDDAALADEVRGVLLETKSAEGAIPPAEELRGLLNEMTVEMRDQFATFRRMRALAGKALTDGDEAAQKLARADMKAATDAMSLIVRTLEKVDGLQRQLARDRELEAERAADEGGYEEAKARFMKLIEERANENAVRLYEAWKRDGPPPSVTELLERKASKPPDSTVGAGEDSGQGIGGFDQTPARDTADT
ncbi:hypothetical protein QTA58_02545 [Neorhizobium sp. CSC1952]|uniref:hypothetical protein n=1 Tax=Neorhizobium sp. CSC1952 TaxID=2978974 RepID=UPI0025A4F1BE|nr:hypothetical protein [Rhizobium sp. CSC1952]WJR67663.1 hypothetical protein QTA58_02545 [Rhizobium sp. CSC1952]